MSFAHHAPEDGRTGGPYRRWVTFRSLLAAPLANLDSFASFAESERVRKVCVSIRNVFLDRFAFLMYG